MFKNLKIGARLGFGFGTILIMMGIVAAIGLMRLGEMWNITSQIVSEEWVKVELANAVDRGVRANARRNLELLITTDANEMAKIREAMNRNRDAISNALDKLEPMLEVIS